MVNNVIRPSLQKYNQIYPIMLVCLKVGSFLMLIIAIKLMGHKLGNRLKSHNALFFFFRITF